MGGGGQINSGFPTNLEKGNVQIPIRPTSWPRPEAGVRRVMINNFSTAGGNISLLIEDSPIVSKDDQVQIKDPRMLWQ